MIVQHMLADRHWKCMWVLEVLLSTVFMGTHHFYVYCMNADGCFAYGELVGVLASQEREQRHPASTVALP